MFVRWRVDGFGRKGDCMKSGTCGWAMGLGLSVAAVGGGSAVLGVTVPYTTALVASGNPSGIASPPILQRFSPPSMASLNYGVSGGWGSVAGFSSANLGTGELKVRAAAEAVSGQIPSVQVNAWFGDGFRARTPSGPFSWSPQSTSRFTMDLRGGVVNSSGPLETLGFGGVGGFVLVSIFQPGTLTPQGRLVGAANSIESFFYRLGNSSLPLRYTDFQGVTQTLTPTAIYPNFSGDFRITQNFRPNGDFDWVVLIGAAGQINGPESFDIDLSHTMTLSYGGPEGTTTTAESGVFENFVAIPEPGAVSVVCAAAVVGLARRRRA